MINGSCAKIHVLSRNVGCFCQEASSDFAEALADLAVGQLVHVGGDSGGSRALEAFLDGAASAKLKKKVIRKLAGSFAKLAGTPGGSHVVQTCYRVGVGARIPTYPCRERDISCHSAPVGLPLNLLFARSIGSSDLHKWKP